MKFNPSCQIETIVKQTSKNINSFFGLLNNVQKEVEKFSSLVIDESTATAKKVSKEFIATGNKISSESLRVSQENINTPLKELI